MSSAPLDLPFVVRFMWTFPHNTHPLPVAEAWDGIFWTVDLSYRAEGHDLDSSATHTDLEHARINAYSHLKRMLNR